MAEVKHSEANGSKEGKTKRVSRSSHANLSFPVGRADRKLRHTLGKKFRIGEQAPVFIAAVMEYLTRELLETTVASMSKKKGKDGEVKKAKRINPIHISRVVEKDVEFRELLKGVSIEAPSVAYKNKGKKKRTVGVKKPVKKKTD